MEWLNYHHLRYFYVVSKEGSLARAAAKLHRTQPAVSQAVKRLEDDLGEQLFDRSSKSGTLTDAGLVQVSVKRTLFWFALVASARK